MSARSLRKAIGLKIEHVHCQCVNSCPVSHFFVNLTTHELLTGFCIEVGESGKLMKIKKPGNQRFASPALL